MESSRREVWMKSRKPLHNESANYLRLPCSLSHLPIRLSPPPPTFPPTGTFANERHSILKMPFHYKHSFGLPHRSSLPEEANEKQFLRGVCSEKFLVSDDEYSSPGASDAANGWGNIFTARSEASVIVEWMICKPAIMKKANRRNLFGAAHNFRLRTRSLHTLECTEGETCVIHISWLLHSTTRNEKKTERRVASRSIIPSASELFFPPLSPRLVA